MSAKRQIGRGPHIEARSAGTLATALYVRVRAPFCRVVLCADPAIWDRGGRSVWGSPRRRGSGESAGNHREKFGLWRCRRQASLQSFQTCRAGIPSRMAAALAGIVVTGCGHDDRRDRCDLRQTG